MHELRGKCKELAEKLAEEKGYRLVLIDGKYYALEWYSGLTESQENIYWDQEAPEVKEIEKTVKITEWVPVGEKP